MHGCQQQKEICCSIFLKAIAAILSFVVSPFAFIFLETEEKRWTYCKDVKSEKSAVAFQNIN